MEGFRTIRSLSVLVLTAGLCFLCVIPVRSTRASDQGISPENREVAGSTISSRARTPLEGGSPTPSPASPEGQDKDLRKHLQAMQEHTRHGRLDQAIQAGQEALAIDSNHVEALAELKRLQHMKAVADPVLENMMARMGGPEQVQTGAPDSQGKAYLEVLDVGEIDWTHGTLHARGVGLPGTSDRETSRRLAQKAAVKMAVYKLLALLCQVRIDHRTLVGEKVGRDGRYEESVRTMLEKARITGQAFLPDGAVEVAMQMPFYFLADPAPPRLGQADPSRPVEYSVFLGKDHFVGSPLQEYGHNHLFQVHAFGNSEIALLPNGCDAFAARIAAIRGAKKSIRIQSLIFSGDESGLYIAEILKQKRQQGVSVKIIIDELSNPDWRDQMMYYDLQRSDIPVEGYEALFLQWVRMLPPLKKMIKNALEGKDMLSIDPDKAEIPYDPLHANKRYHEKMWIVDGETDHGTAIVGGRNIANAYFKVNDKDPRQLWRDQDVIVKGSIVKDMVTAFDRTFTGLWNEKENQLVNFNKTWEEWNKLCNMTTGYMSLLPSVDSELMSHVVAMAGKKLNFEYRPVKARFFQNQTRLGETYITQAYLKLLNESNEILIANAYFIPSKDLIAAIKTAVRRGALVKIVTNSLGTNDVPDMTIVGRHYYREILSVNDEPEVVRRNALKAEDEPRAGVEIWEWQGELRNGMGTLHAKYAVFDKRVCLVGSHNLDPRSEFLNSETAIVIENESLGQELASIFYETDISCSRRITVAEAEEFHSPKDIGNKMRKAFGRLFEDML